MEGGPGEPRVVWVNGDVVVVDKPSGMPTQPDASGGGGDLARWVSARFPDATLVHRLDQPASGLVVFARTSAARRALDAALKAHRLDRRYGAVLAGALPAGAEEVRWSWPVDGRPAETLARVVGAGNGMMAVELRLVTGRTHQIRQHAARAGAPVVGDRRYGGEVGRWWPRLALHARALTLPGGAGVEAPIPEDLATLWAQAGGA